MMPSASKLQGFLSSPAKIQHCLSIESAESKAQSMVEAAMLARDAARLHSLHGNGAGAWLNAVPTSVHFKLHIFYYCLASYMKLGFPIPVSEWMETCHLTTVGITS